jgi:hypothetical protein
MPKPKPVKPEILWVQILEAKPNKMFTKEITDMLRFLRFNHAVPCAACGKKKRTLWTMLSQFKAVDFENSQFVAKEFPQSFAPLTPVCDDHPLHPDWPKDEAEVEAEKGASATRNEVK